MNKYIAVITFKPGAFTPPGMYDATKRKLKRILHLEAKTPRDAGQQAMTWALEEHQKTAHHIEQLMIRPKPPAMTYYTPIPKIGGDYYLREVTWNNSPIHKENTHG